MYIGNLNDLSPQQRRELFLASNNDTEEDLPVVTVQASFDWKFWALLALAAIVLYQEMKRAPR